VLIPLSKDEVIPVAVAQKKNGKARNNRVTKKL